MKGAPTIPSYEGIQHSTYKMPSQLLNHTFQNVYISRATLTL